MSFSARNAWLDTLRALAIFVVVTCHSASGFRQDQGVPSNAIFAVLGLGGHGVDLFFVLSGWLLGNVLFRELERTKTIHVPRFWSRRWLRTLPAYFAVLAFTLLQRFIQGRLEVRDAWYFIFGQTYAFSELPFFGISWSLCVEEHFYLLIAPLLLIGGRRRVFTTSVLLALNVIPCLLRAGGFYSNVDATHVHIDQCAMGVLLAHLSIAYPAIWKWINRWLPLLLSISVAIVIGLLVSRFLQLPFDLPLIAYSCLSGILVALSQRGAFWQDRATHPIVRYVAIRSYSLYLIHVEAIAVLKYLHVSNFLLYFCLTWLLSIAMAEVLYRVVERPGMQLRDRPFRWFGLKRVASN